MPLIREERFEDYDAIRALNLAAFQGVEEADLVDRLRNDGAEFVSLVALEGDQIVGHIMFSDLAIGTKDGVVRAVSLAPVAVLPEFQHRGIGSALVRSGLEVCRERGEEIAVVLGIPTTIPASASHRNWQKALIADIQLTLAMLGWPSNAGEREDCHFSRSHRKPLGGLWRN